MKLFRFVIAASIWVCLQFALKCFAQNPYVHEISDAGLAEIELQELTQSTHFSWPRTLLNYRVRWNAKSIDPAKLQLIDTISGKPVRSNGLI